MGTLAPGITIALCMAVLNSVLAVIVSFGVNLSQTQSSAITAAVNAILVLIVAILHTKVGNSGTNISKS